MPAENKLAALVEQGCPVFYFYSTEKYLVRQAVGAAAGVEIGLRPRGRGLAQRAVIQVQQPPGLVHAHPVARVGGVQRKQPGARVCVDHGWGSFFAKNSGLYPAGVRPQISLAPLYQPAAGASIAACTIWQTCRILTARLQQSASYPGRCGGDGRRRRGKKYRWFFRAGQPRQKLRRFRGSRTVPSTSGAGCEMKKCRCGNMRSCNGSVFYSPVYAISIS